MFCLIGCHKNRQRIRNRQPNPSHRADVTGRLNLFTYRSVFKILNTGELYSFQNKSHAKAANKRKQRLSANSGFAT